MEKDKEIFNELLLQQVQQEEQEYIEQFPGQVSYEHLTEEQKHIVDTQLPADQWFGSEDWSERVTEIWKTENGRDTFFDNDVPKKS